MDLDIHLNQGVEFKNLAKDKKADDYIFLQKTSSPEVGSIVEAFTHDSARGSNKHSLINIVRGLENTDDEIKMKMDKTRFNQLISTYVTSYNTYTSTMLHKSPTDRTRIAMEADLVRQKNNIISIAMNIKNDILRAEFADKFFTEFKTLTNDMQRHQTANVFRMINEKKTGNVIKNNDSLDGMMETTNLSMTSMYYHLFVYLAIAITLIAFILNLMTNANADPMKAIVVVGSLFIVFYISQKYVNNI
jgi:hypothetical protein